MNKSSYRKIRHMKKEGNMSLTKVKLHNFIVMIMKWMIAKEL
jgi:hypothetical protein